MHFNIKAYEDVVSDTHPLAKAVVEILGDKRLVCGDMHVPPKWLWHGGRLLPALIWAAAKQADATKTIAFSLLETRWETPNGPDYLYLGRAFAGDLYPLMPHCEDVLKKLFSDGFTMKCETGPVVFVQADFLVELFMKDHFQEASGTDDQWIWLMYKAFGCNTLPFELMRKNGLMAHDWREWELSGHKIPPKVTLCSDQVFPTVRKLDNKEAKNEMFSFLMECADSKSEEPVPRIN